MSARGTGKARWLRGGTLAAGRANPVHETVLDNGMKVILVETHTLPVVTSMLWYRVGARDERSGETGVSHFLEHMMFKGTPRYRKGEIDQITQRLGGHNNAFTDNDVTAYYFSLAADRWQAALEIEQSRMRDCLLDPAEFAAEKNVVLEELAMGEDDPDRALGHAVEATAFAVHPYHHPVIGWRDDLRVLTRDRMADYYRRHYAPDRAVLVVVGDLDRRRTLARVRELFEGIAPSGAERAPVLAEPPQKGERRVTLHFPGNIPRLAIAWRGCRIGEPDDFALDLLTVILGSGKSSRLYKALVEGEEILGNVSAHNDARLDPGLFWILAELKADESLAHAEASVLAQVERVRRHGVTTAELDRARTLIASGFAFEKETAMDQANRIGRAETGCAEGHRLLGRYLRAIAAIGAREVQAAAQRLLGDRTRTIGCVVPEPEADPVPRAKRPTKRRARARR